MRKHLPLLMHTFPSITADSVMAMEYDLVLDCIEFARQSRSAYAES